MYNYTDIACFCCIVHEANVHVVNSLCDWCSYVYNNFIILQYNNYVRQCYYLYIAYFVTTVDSIWSKSVSCWILPGCNVPFLLANTQTAATVLNMEAYEKKYLHTMIKIKNNKEKIVILTRSV